MRDTKRWYLFHIFLSSVLSLSVQALSIQVNSEPLRPSLTELMEKKISSSKIPRHELGLYVSKLGSSSPLYNLNGTKAFVPASLTKIITAAAILDGFPVGHQFVTQILSDARIESGVLLGSLYFKGGGDPGLVSENLWVLVNELIRTGIKEVKGDLVVDSSRFEDEPYPSRTGARVDRAYDAPVSAASFNWNCVNVYIRPGITEGSPARVYADPENEFVVVTNKAKTGRATRLSVSRTEIKVGSGVKNQITVSGTIDFRASEQVFYKSITRAELWTGYNLKAFLKQRGVLVKGDVKEGRLPANSQLLGEIKSKSISAMVADMAKFSNNFVAEILTKNLGFEVNGEPGNLSKGVEGLKAYLDRVGIARDQYSLFSPSGLNKQNSFTPTDLFKVLEDVSKRFNFFPEFLTGLPIAGVDGTLRSRFRNLKNRGGVRAKTGFLTGVVGLAGYAQNQEDTIGFVFMFNGKSAQEGVARKLFDELSLTLSGET